MKVILIVSYLIWIPYLSYAQDDSTQDLEAYFSAIIVSDIDSSINWYTKILGFEVVNRIESDERGFKQSNLKRGKMLMELIELDKAVNLEAIVPNYNNKLRMIGFFKIGFLVTDFDNWIDHFTFEKVNSYGSIVTDETTGKRMVIITDPDGNRIQIFEN